MSLFLTPSLDLQYSDNDLSQTTNTNAYSGDSFFGYGSDANAVTSQIGASRATTSWCRLTTSGGAQPSGRR
jgi:hypothetical protein